MLAMPSFAKSLGGEYLFTRKRISLMLAIYFSVLWTAVILRIDRFPLTWAPMYSVYYPVEGDAYPVILKDRHRIRERGWRATRRDGEVEWLSQNDINVPGRSMWRLYYERTYQYPPPKYKHLNYDAGSIDRWLWGLAPGESFVSIDWQRRLFESINKTLGRQPGDSGFIVVLEAESETMFFDRETLRLTERVPRNILVKWQESWAEGF
jgi:hypothetical protein